MVSTALLGFAIATTMGKYKNFFLMHVCCSTSVNAALLLTTLKVPKTHMSVCHDHQL